jgi:hypothetical protein
MIDDEYEESIDRIIAQFLEDGIIEIHGFDNISEQITYRLTAKAKQVLPELFEEHLAFVNQLAFDLWEKGYIEMKFELDGSPMVMLKDLNYEADVYPHINEEERFFIENMRNVNDEGMV